MKNQQNFFVELISYTEKEIQFQKFSSFEDVDKHTQKITHTHWIKSKTHNFNDFLEKLKKELSLEENLIEDISETNLFSQVESYDSGLFFQLKFLDVNKKNGLTDPVQISILLNKNKLLLFENHETTFFDPLIKKLENQHSKIRKKGADYLFLNTIDHIIENYYFLTESLAQNVENIENRLLENEKISIQEIVKIKNQYFSLQDYLFYLKDALTKLHRENSLQTEKIARHLDDALDQSSYLVDFYLSYKNRVASLIDLHMANMNNQMNKVVQTLTIFSSIFLPITFITSLYGMNFKHMPELEWKYGYFGILGLLCVIVISIIWITKKKHWW